MAEVRSQNDRKEHDTVTTPRHLAQFSISRLNTVDIDSFPTCENDAHTSDSNEMECDGGFRSSCNYVAIMLCREGDLLFLCRSFCVALCPAKCSFHIVVQLCSLDPHLLQYFVSIGDEFLEHFFHHIHRVGVGIFLRVILGMLIILVLLHRGLDSGTRGCLFPSRGSFNRTTAM